MSEGFEAKKHAYRQTQDGILVSFVIHPNDMPEALALAALGTRYMVGIAEIGDDERPKEPRAAKGEASADSVSPAGAPRETKGKRKFSDLSLQEQCGIRCEDERFWQWLRFNGYDVKASGHAITVVRNQCGVESRAELSKNDNAANKWRIMESAYQAWLLDQKYADVRR